MNYPIIGTCKNYNLYLVNYLMYEGETCKFYFENILTTDVKELLIYGYYNRLLDIELFSIIAENYLLSF